MPKHLQGELEKLKRQMLSLSMVAEENVRQAVQALETRDARPARKVGAPGPQP